VAKGLVSFKTQSGVLRPVLPLAKHDRQQRIGVGEIVA